MRDGWGAGQLGTRGWDGGVIAESGHPQSSASADDSRTARPTIAAGPEIVNARQVVTSKDYILSTQRDISEPIPPGSHHATSLAYPHRCSSGLSFRRVDPGPAHEDRNRSWGGLRPSGSAKGMMCRRARHPHATAADRTNADAGSPATADGDGGPRSPSGATRPGTVRQGRTQPPPSALRTDWAALGPAGSSGTVGRCGHQGSESGSSSRGSRGHRARFSTWRDGSIPRVPRATGIGQATTRRRRKPSP